MADFAMTDQVRARLADEGIGEDLLARVFAEAQLEIEGFFDEESQSAFLPAIVGPITLWVQYREEGDAIRILDAYYHRISVEGVQGV